MIDLYFWSTPNGHKLTIFLDATGTAYKRIPVHIGPGEQFKPGIDGHAKHFLNGQNADTVRAGAQ